MKLPNYWSRQSRIDNQSNIDSWVENKLRRIKKNQNNTLLDIGAGLKRYESCANRFNWSYLSHDFNLYQANKFDFGLQHDEWPPLDHDFICDILDIPEQVKFNLVLCTEVLEHVPDPVATLKKIRKLVSKDSNVLITVPLLSLVHQAPYYFSSGLSPFWFEYWSKECGFKIVEGVISGDFLDTYNQLLDFIWNSLPGNSVKRTLAPRPDKEVTKILTASLPKNLLESGGFGVFVHLKVC